MRKNSAGSSFFYAVIISQVFRRGSNVYENLAIFADGEVKTFRDSDKSYSLALPAKKVNAARKLYFKNKKYVCTKHGSMLKLIEQNTAQTTMTQLFNSTD